MNGMFSALIGIFLAVTILVNAVDRGCTKDGEFAFKPYDLVIECSVKETNSAEAE